MNNETANALLHDSTIIKSSIGDYVVYNRKWLMKHLEEEYELLKGAKAMGDLKPFSREDFERWMKEEKTNE